MLNGDRVNTMRALWLDDKATITPTQYQEFYRYVANAFDTPRYTLHFHTDAPLSIHALFFMPLGHTEKMGTYMAHVPRGFDHCGLLWLSCRCDWVSVIFFFFLSFASFFFFFSLSKLVFLCFDDFIPHDVFSLGLLAQGSAAWSPV